MISGVFPDSWQVFVNIDDKPSNLSKANQAFLGEA